MDAFAFMRGGKLHCGMDFVKAAEADVTRVWPSIVHELGGHIAYGGMIGNAVIANAVGGMSSENHAVATGGKKLGGAYGYMETEILPAIRWLVARPSESRPPVRLIVRAMRVEPATGHALEVLGLIGDPRDVPLIAEVLRHPDAPETMPWDAAGALAAHQANEAEAALLSALDDPQGDVVDAAISALGDRRSEAARTRLEALLDHPIAATRYRVVLALKDLGHEQSAAALRKRAKVETGQYVKKVLADLGY